MNILKKKLLFGFVLAALLFSIPNLSVANTTLPFQEVDNNIEFDDALFIKIKIIIIIKKKKKKKGLIGEVVGMKPRNNGGQLGKNQYLAEVTIDGNSFLIEIAGLKEKLDVITIPKGFSATDDEVRAFGRDFKLKGGNFKPTINSLGNFEIQDFILE